MFTNISSLFWYTNEEDHLSFPGDRKPTVFSDFGFFLALLLAHQHLFACFWKNCIFIFNPNMHSRKFNFITTVLVAVTMVKWENSSSVYKFSTVWYICKYQRKSFHFAQNYLNMPSDFLVDSVCFCLLWPLYIMHFSLKYFRPLMCYLNCVCMKCITFCKCLRSSCCSSLGYQSQLHPRFQSLSKHEKPHFL